LGPPRRHGLARGGKLLSSEHRAAIGKGITGRPVSPETRERIAATKRGELNPRSPPGGALTRPRGGVWLFSFSSRKGSIKIKNA